MTMKKKLLTTLSVVLILGLAALGILAYLTDTDSDVNVMTLGNVDIEQHEYERATNTDGSYETKEIDGVTSYVLKDFTQGKPLLPIVGDPNEPGDSPAYAGFDETIVRMTQVDSYGSMQVFAGKNAQDKFVTVENTGKSDAYVRTLVAIECGTGNTALIGTGNRCVAADEAASSTMPWIKYEIGKIVVDNNTYLLFEYVYRGASDVKRHVNGILPAGDTTYPNLCQVYLKHNATNEDMVAIDGNGNGTLDILVLSQAGQVKGFESVGAASALNTMFGDVTAENAAKWFGGMGNVEYIEVEGEKVSVEGEAAAAILEDLESGKDIIVDKNVDILAFNDDSVNAKGATVTLDGQGAEAYGYLAFAPGKGKDTKVENLNVEGSGFVEVGHYGEGGGTYEVNKLTIKDLVATLAVTNGSDKVAAAFAHYGTATLNNCVMTGTTTEAVGYNAYDAGFVNGTKTTIDGGKYGKLYLWNQAHVTINNAEVDTIDSSAITYKNLGKLTIGAGAKVGTINLIPGSYSPSLVIEDGATVGKIVYNGTTYTQAEWLDR